MTSLSPLKIGIAGLGTVGMGTLRLLTDSATGLAMRTGQSMEVLAVSSRDKSKDRGMDLSSYRWYSDARELAVDPAINVVVETIGGEGGLALEVVEKALEAGKHVVTANKALLAHHGHRLAALAEEKGVSLMFEAAVAGGIPAIKKLREGLAANRFTAVYGILNGTCNYILTTMRETGRSFDDVLAEAQALGYAEAEPSTDVDGFDAAHKLALITSVAFGTQVDYDSLTVRGIRRVTADDIATTDELGYRIKLLGMARLLESGAVEQYVRPVLVPKGSPIASVEGVFNAVVAQADPVDQVMTVGRGAGAGPTGSAVVADLVDLARGIRTTTFGVPVSSLEAPVAADIGDLKRAVYMNLTVTNEPGVLAQVTGILGQHDVSISGCIQHSAEPNVPVALIITTHVARYGDIKQAIDKLDALACCVEPVHMMMIEDL